MIIKPIPSIHFLLSLFAAASLAACAGPRGGPVHGQHQARHSGAGLSGTSSQGGMIGAGTTGSHAGCGMMGAGAAGNRPGCATMGDSKAAGPGAVQPVDQATMCSMYRGMQDAPDDPVRQAMMDRLMPGMPPETRRQHMEMMRQQCQ